MLPHDLIDGPREPLLGPGRVVGAEPPHDASGFLLDNHNEVCVPRTQQNILRVKPLVALREPLVRSKGGHCVYVQVVRIFRRLDQL
jgi:hypothetical protein